MEPRFRASRVVAFQVVGNLANGQSFSAVLSSASGVSFQDLVDSTMNPEFASLTLLGFDNTGDFAFFSGPIITDQFLFISLAGGPPILAASIGNSPSGTSGAITAFLNNGSISAFAPVV